MQRLSDYHIDVVRNALELWKHEINTYQIVTGSPTEKFLKEAAAKEHERRERIALTIMKQIEGKTNERSE